MKPIALIAVLLLFCFLLFGCTQESIPPGDQPFGGNPNGPGQYGPEGDPGDQNWLQNPPPQNGSPQGNEFNLPPLDSDAPLPSLPSDVPKGAWVTKKLGAVEIKYFSTVIARGLSESGADFIISLKNTGSTKATLCFPSLNDFSEGTGTLRENIPSWNLHFFAMQDSPMDINPGEEKKLWYFVSLDQPRQSENSFFTVPFNINFCESTADSVEISETFGVTNEVFDRGPPTALIYGTIKDEEGKALPQTDIMATMNCGRVGFRGMPTPEGNYSIGLLGTEDINALYPERKPLCDSTDYFVTASASGYEYYYSDHLVPTRGKPILLDIVLKKKSTSVSYSLDWEKRVQDNYGFFWVKPSNDWSVFAAAQAKHPPMLGKPTNFYMFDSEGELLWKQPTGDECWGIDIFGDGSKVVAGCHDKKIYLVDKAGTLLWSSDVLGGTISRNVCFSREGDKIIAGDPPAFVDLATGTMQEIDWSARGIQRNCAFYPDNSGFIVGAREVTGFDAQGNQKWLNVIGEFPLFLGVDPQKNSFAAGKSRMLFSFDSEGKLRWQHKIPDHVITAGAISADGGRIAIGTVGGMVYLFDNGGNLLWKRTTSEAGPDGFVGHNAVAISDDGKLIVVGTAPQNCVLAFNETGTLIWKYCVDPIKDNPDFLVGVMNVQISPDKKQIIAAYGDNYIRKFSLEE